MNEQTKELVNDIRQYEQAVLTINLPEKDLKAGDVGTVVDVHLSNGITAGYSLEFFTLSGETLAVATVKADAVRPVNSDDRMHERT